MSKLTPKQEKFVLSLIEGLSQREAYKQSYNCNKMKETTLDVKASKLFKMDKIRIRYDELQKKHEEKALWTKEQSVRELIWMKDTAKNDINSKGVRQANSSAFLNAIKELNEVEGIKVDKVQVEHSGGVKVDNPYAGLTIEELRILARSKRKGETQTDV